MADRRRLTREEMRLVLALEREKCIGATTFAPLRREYRERCKQLVAHHLTDEGTLRGRLRGATGALAAVSLTMRSVHAHAQTAFNEAVGWPGRVDDCAECGVLTTVEMCRDEAKDEVALFCSRCRDDYGLDPAEGLDVGRAGR